MYIIYFLLVKKLRAAVTAADSSGVVLTWRSTVAVEVLACCAHLPSLPLLLQDPAMQERMKQMQEMMQKPEMQQQMAEMQVCKQPLSIVTVIMYIQLCSYIHPTQQQ
jgi:hypothetical protein